MYCQEGIRTSVTHLEYAQKWDGEPLVIARPVLGGSAPVGKLVFNGEQLQVTKTIVNE